MRKTVLILVLFITTLTIYSCSVDEINTPQTQSIKVPVESEPVEPVTKVNAGVPIEIIADTLLPNKENRTLIMEMEAEGNGNVDTGDIPDRR